MKKSPPKFLTLTLKLALALAAALAVPSGLVAQSTLPELGGGDLALGTERRLGDSVVREFYKDPDLFEDPLLQLYIDELFAPLLQAARRRGDLSSEMQERFAWKLFIGKDRSVNAFALPGGYFGVHAGLIMQVGSRDELASVLAHELSHVTQRHISRNINKQASQAPWQIAGMILGAIALGKNADLANAAIVGSQAAGAQLQLNFSRDMEREADRVGFAILSEAGYKPTGMPAMFERLQAASRLNDSGNFPYLRSHPLTTERIADATARLSTAPVLAGDIAAEKAAGPDFWHLFMVARAKVLSDAGADSLRAYAAELGATGFDALPEGKRASHLYAGALALHRLRQFDASRTAFKRLNAFFVKDPRALLAIKIAANEMELSAAGVDDLAARGLAPLRTSSADGGRPGAGSGSGSGAGAGAPDRRSGPSRSRPDAVRPPHVQREPFQAEPATARPVVTYSGLDRAFDALAGLPSTGAARPALIAQANTWLAAGQHDQAAELLQNWLGSTAGRAAQSSLASPSQDGPAWRLLARAHEAQGKTVRAIEAQAQASWVELDWTGALDRLRAAQSLLRSQGGNHIDASIIDTKVRELQSLLREQAVQDRNNRQLAQRVNEGPEQRSAKTLHVKTIQQ